MARSGKKGNASGPLTTIIIPVFNNLELTKDCLESLKENTAGNYEVLVVDNASTDGTPDYLESAGFEFLRMDKNGGFPPAVNAGVRHARGDYVCFLNNDTILLPGWLPLLVRHLEKTPRAAMAGPVQISSKGTIYHAGTVFTPRISEVAHVSVDPSEYIHRVPMHIYITFPSKHPAANVARSYPAMNFGCALIRRALFDEIGFLDEETFTFPGNHEDVDWCLRVRKAGYTCDLRPRSRIMHIISCTQFGLGDEFTEKCRRGERDNLQRLLDKWKDEPEELFAPSAIRLTIDEYLKEIKKEREKNAALQREGCLPGVSQAGAGHV